MKINPQLLTTAEEIRHLASVLSHETIIAFDTEFIRESTFFPIVEIIQIATDKESWIVDAQFFKKKFRAQDPQSYDPLIQPLLDIFKDQKILKVVHAAQGDQECLYTSFNTIASPILDTALAASLCGLGEGIGLAKLLKTVLDVNVTKGHARTNWSIRPLPIHLIDYAHSDVIHLVRLGNQLLKELEILNRKNWALQLSTQWEKPEKYEANIEEMLKKVSRNSRLSPSGRSVLMGLLKWREDRVRNLNLPRRWIADDHVLLDLAYVQPKDIQHLSSFRGLNKNEIKNSGSTLLQIIAEEQKKELHIQEKESVHRSPTIDESRAHDLLQCFIGILGDRYQIASKYLLSSSQALELLRANPQSMEELSELQVFTPEAFELIGNKVLSFINGQYSLTLNQKKIGVTHFNGNEI